MHEQQFTFVRTFQYKVSVFESSPQLIFASELLYMLDTNS